LFSEGGAECDSSAFNNVDRRRTLYVPNSLELIYNGSLPAAGSSATVGQEDGQENTGCEFHFSGLKFHGKRPSSILMSLKLIYNDDGSLPEASAALGSLELRESGVVTRSGGSELEQEKSQNQSCGNLVDLPKNSRPQGSRSGLNRLKLSKTAGRRINKGTSSESERLEEEGDVQNSSNDDMEPVVDPEVSLS
jgi:hypothetical protein